MLGLAALGAVILVVNPRQVGIALAHFQLGYLSPILACYVLIYLFQAARWHGLLEEIGARLDLVDSVLLNAGGQAITALVPLGDLTRAAFAAQATGTSFGEAAATVTVQELTYTLILVLLALPVVLGLHVGVYLVALTLAGMAGIILILTVSRVFCRVHALVARIPLLRRLLPAIDELQHSTAELLHRPDTLLWSVLDLARALATVAAFWLVLRGLTPHPPGWWEAAFVLAVSSIGGAISLIPGGVGANEAGVAGLLVLFGVPPGTAGAAALIQRALLTGIATAFGWSAYALARRRFRLGGIFQVTVRHEEVPAAA